MSRCAPALRHPLSPGAKLPEIDEDQLERQLTSATRAWADDFADTLADQVGEEAAARLMRRYGRAFPEAFKEDFPARIAVADLRRLELPDGDGLALNLYPADRRRPRRAPAEDLHRPPVSLAAVLPLLSRMGVEVVDGAPVELARRQRHSGASTTSGFATTGRARRWNCPPLSKAARRPAGHVVRRGKTADFGSTLVLAAGLTRRQVVVWPVRCRQTGIRSRRPVRQEWLVAGGVSEYRAVRVAGSTERLSAVARGPLAPSRTAAPASSRR